MGVPSTCAEVDAIVKRSRIKPKVSDFEREFQSMKPLVISRSMGYCESWPFVRDMDRETQMLYHEHMAMACQFRNPVHVHHRKFRSRGGTNSRDNLIHLCEPCHSFIHSHPEIADKLRFALHAGESEEL